MSSRYPPKFLNNQSDRSSVVKREGQKSFAFLPVITTKVGSEINDLKVYMSTNIQHKMGEIAGVNLNIVSS